MEVYPRLVYPYSVYILETMFWSELKAVNIIMKVTPRKATLAVCCPRDIFIIAER